MIAATQHWSQRYIGQPYAEANCAQFAAQVRREVFGQAIKLPAHIPTAVHRQSRAIAQARADYGVPTEAPADGDAVAMLCGQLWHVGVYCRIGGQAYILHAMKAAGAVVLHRPRDLARHQIKIEGYYKWL